MLEVLKSRDGYSAAIPPLVIAGRPLVFVIGGPAGSRAALDELTLRWSLISDGAAFWDDVVVTEVRNAHQIRITDPTRHSASELTLSIPTLAHWKGTLLLSLLPGPDAQPLTAMVLLVDQEEMDEVSREVRRLTGGDLPESPTQGAQEFRVTDTLRLALRLAEEASHLLGPQVILQKNFRPHQQSLEVLAGWRNPTFPVLVGSPQRLVTDTVRVVGAIRDRFSGPAEGRPAYQIFVRGGRPWLVIQFSFPVDGREDDLITAGLQQSLEEMTKWEYKVFVKEKRLYVFGRIGPFGSHRPSDQEELDLEAP